MSETRPLSPSLVRCSEQPAKKPRMAGTIEALFDKPPLQEPIVSWRAKSNVAEITGKRVVDLFCGLGGFSQGAVDAGHTVVLAVDNWPQALDAHRRNHPDAAHALMTLGPRTEERLVQMIQKHIPDGCAYHIHLSPPCQKLSKMAAVKVGMAVEDGLDLVCWALRLVLRLKPTTWSFEEVDIRDLRGALFFAKYMHPEEVDYGVFRMSEYGIPQSRVRIIAGSPEIIHRLRTDTSLCAPAPVVTDVLTPPSNAVYMRSSVGMTPTAERPERCGDVRLIDKLCWTCTASNAHAWLDRDRKHIREFSLVEQLILQTFLPCTKLPKARQAALRLIGNALPVAFAAKIMKT